MLQKIIVQLYDLYASRQHIHVLQGVLLCSPTGTIFDPKHMGIDADQKDWFEDVRDKTDKRHIVQLYSGCGCPDDSPTRLRQT